MELIIQPTCFTCGQACIAMIAGKSVDKVIKDMKTDGATSIGQLIEIRKIGGYYYMIGGGVHLGENFVNGIEREILEETGMYVKADRLSVICENFFQVMVVQLMERIVTLLNFIIS